MNDRRRGPIGLRATESGLQENFRRIAATASAVPVLVGQYIHPDPLVRVFSYAFPQAPKQVCVGFKLHWFFYALDKIFCLFGTDFHVLTIGNCGKMWELVGASLRDAGPTGMKD